MATLTESPVYEAGIYQWETTDAALAGVAGIMNTPPSQLANRTAWLKSRADTLYAGGHSVAHADIQFNNSTPANGRHEITNATTGGFNVTAGRCDVSFDFLSTNYFTQNPNGHLAVVLRCDTAVINTAVRGQGIVIGNVIGAQEGAAHAPAVQIETWYGGVGPAAPPQRWLIPGTENLATKPMVDGVLYRFAVSSIVQPTGHRFIRYRMYRWNSGVSAWDCERDTGDVLDQNPWFDATKAGLVFGHVFANGGASAWTITIANISTNWGPCGPHVTQVPTWSITGAGGGGASTVAQDLTFTGVAARQKIDSSNATLNNRWAFQNIATNQPTTVMAVPAGTATVSNFLAVNKNALTGAFSYLSFGINGNSGVLETLGIGGGATPSILFKPGGGTVFTVAPGSVDVAVAMNTLSVTTTGTINATGQIQAPYFRVTGAGYQIGDSAFFTGPTNTNGSQVSYWRTAAVDMNQAATPGYIQGYTSAGVEAVVRPLYGIVGQLLQELKNRKVI